MTRARRGLAVVASVLALGGVAATSAHGSGPLTAPVIHERFSTPRCSGSPGRRSTAELVGCAEREILRRDREIDRLNRQIFAPLYDAAGRRDLLAGHEAWLRYRTAYCQSAADAYEGGTLAQVVDVDCASDVDSAHVRDLERFRRDLQGDQGDVALPTAQPHGRADALVSV